MQAMIKRTTKIFLPAILLIMINSLQAQDYRAINGSSYAGSLGAANNPASIVHVPSVWDITPMALQFKQTTNAVFIDSLSYISDWKHATANSRNGTFERFALANQDMRLLNVRIRINSNSAVAFGLSGRTYLSAKTSSLNIQDTIGPLREFMGINTNNTPASAEVRGHGWAEIYGTYARTIVMYDNAILNAGITVKLNYGVAGGYMTTSGLTEVAGTVNNKPGYYLNNGNLDYGYSSNMDVLDSSTEYNKALRQEFFRNTFSTVGISLGAEYIVPESNGDDNGYGYSLKIGASLLDIGNNKFHYSNYSRNAVLNKNNISDSLIEASFKDVDGPATFADSLDVIAGTTNTLSGNFKIYQPTRLVINVDKHIAGNFFINGDLTVPLISALKKKQLFARDMNFLSLTPRFETKGFGFYLPASLNTQMDLWIGGAFKFGPLLLGIHNWANIFSKNKILNGGAYLALTFRFGKSERDDNSEGEKMSGKQLKQLDCPPRVQ